ncbi:MAG: cell surface protein SprA, partial [Bacteroidaceae bacterium]|nr:cell surface protein SprA [Bacteroidaceae bacterium]
MGKRTLTLFALLLATISILAQGGVRNDSIRKSLRARKRGAETAVLDTAAQARFPVAETTPTNIDDIQQRPLDLKAPENIVTDTVYNEEDGTYLLSTRLGKGGMLTAPILLTPEEYAKWKERSAMSSFFRKKNYEAWENSQKKNKFDFTDMHFDLGPAEKIFGPGGVRVKTQGNAELKIGYSIQSIDNPALPSRSRRTNSFDFDEKINLNVRGSVGDKMNMDFNYNTEATFSYDAKKINLKYDGKEDEIIKLVEAGNVSFPTNSSLIKGATSLFGIRTDLQFGKLLLQTVVSQKTSNSTVVNSKGGTQLTTFEIEITNYDENKHFFLAHYFRDNYDRSMSQLPTILSGIDISRIEVWVTNKTSDYNNPRNIVAFTDIAENRHISNPTWSATGSNAIPHNNANDLYTQMNTTYSGIRDIDQANNILGNIEGINGGSDYEKLSNARLLSTSEYTLNRALGYISLKTPLRADEVLAVAYEYTYGGQTYQVGEFSSDVKESKT